MTSVAAIHDYLGEVIHFWFTEVQKPLEFFLKLAVFLNFGQSEHRQVARGWIEGGGGLSGR